MQSQADLLHLICKQKGSCISASLTHAISSTTNQIWNAISEFQLVASFMIFLVIRMVLPC